MGMCAYFVPVTGEQIALFTEEPDELIAFLFPDDLDQEPEGRIDADKAWHAIHFLLNGSAMPEETDPAPAIFGGEPIGEELDYGPARVLQPAEVQALAGTLAGIDAAQLRARYVPEQLTEADIYPSMWDRNDDTDLDYVIENYLHMATFYRGAAERGDGVLLYIA
ncbi:DUF1877 family protein [Pseudoduganella sp. FT26W]|uniref:DUF1877 family protein n=2 Tax=Duganella aquatilis TaxID=2666082 RepID=A0A844D9T7_9BURK|nr:DUF1877 family protein [Duganella aquatilis]